MMKRLFCHLLGLSTAKEFSSRLEQKFRNRSLPFADDFHCVFNFRLFVYTSPEIGNLIV